MTHQKEQVTSLLWPVTSTLDRNKLRGWGGRPSPPSGGPRQGATHSRGSPLTHTHTPSQALTVS
jgi:hypothetical protein